MSITYRAYATEEDTGRRLTVKVSMPDHLAFDQTEIRVRLWARLWEIVGIRFADDPDAMESHWSMSDHQQLENAA